MQMRTKNSFLATSRRGAARISAVWMIAVIVLLFMVLAYAFIAQGEASAAQQELKEARLEQDAAIDRRSEAISEVAERSAVLGFTEDAATVPSDVTAAESALEDAKSAFPDTESVKTFQDLVPVVKKAYEGKLETIDELKSQISTLESELEAARTATADVSSEKQSTIDTLTKERDDLEASLRADIERLETANSQFQTELADLGTTITQLSNEKSLSESEVKKLLAMVATTRRQASQRLLDIGRRSEKPDGEITAVQTDYGIGYINLSASDRLSEGTVFSIVSGRPGADKDSPKAFAEVTDVGPERSEVRIYGVVDPLGQPVVSGDKIFNPLYEKKGRRYAMIAGSLAGYTKPELTALLEGIGITVQEEVNNLTDYLITGGPIFSDESGEPLETPKPVEETEVYAEAQDAGVLVVPMRDVLQFFRR